MLPSTTLPIRKTHSCPHHSGMEQSLDNDAVHTDYQTNDVEFIELFFLFQKTNKRLKEHFLIGRNRTKRAHFPGSPLFQATYNIKTEEKKTINSTYLVSVGCGRLAEGTGHGTDSFVRQLLPASLSTPVYLITYNKPLRHLILQTSSKSEFDGHNTSSVTGSCCLCVSLL